MTPFNRAMPPFNRAMPPFNEERNCETVATVPPGFHAIEQLRQLVTATWDGNIINKPMRDELHKAGLVARSHGYNVLTEKGMEYCVVLGILRP